MPRKAANAPAPAPTRSRRSAGVTEFLSLDLYSSARKVEKAVNVFKADENHNGIKVEPATINQPSAVNMTPVALKKRRHVKTEVVSPPAKTPNKSHSRSSSVASSVQTQSSVVAPKRRRIGKGGANRSVTTRNVTKSPEKRGAITVAKSPKNERASSVQTLASVAKVAPKRVARGKAPAKKKTIVKQEIHSDDEMQEEIPVIKKDLPVIMNEPDDEIEVKPDIKARRAMGTSSDASSIHKRLRSAITENAVVNNSQLSFRKQKEVVSRLEEIVSCATTMTLVNYDNVIRNLTMCEKYIKETRELLNPDSDLQDKVASLEAEKREWQRDRTAWTKEKSKLNKTVDERQSEVEKAKKKVEEVAEERANLQKEMQHLKAQLEAIAKSAATERSSAVSTSSSTSLYDRNERPGPSTRQANNNQLARQKLPRGISAPADPRYDLQHMPKGSAVGRSMVAGRANQLIAGLNHVAGMEDAYASVDVTAATIPETDDHGNVIQRTIRTTTQRIIVPEGSSLEELERLGTVVAKTGETTEEEDEDEEEEMEEQNQRNRLRVEEVNEEEEEDEDEDDYSENGEEALPLIEEVE
ncbi:hypothetical protein PENTCL1PPCAC_18915 [Pristionchus entomophagus]|uniref:Uncharacterized protein n=1 Tax=Pristionchus entomophagus TaxID=358040 RepID=A0AAV5TQL7_9BILA|nr:hypothetical protein PENTCL1PPCAC_18915 [Pristionchus entomophagus]